MCCTPSENFQCVSKNLVNAFLLHVQIVGGTTILPPIESLKARHYEGMT